MKKLKKLSLLKDEELQKIKGGIVSDGMITTFGADTNTERKCNCSGTGSNANNAQLCTCSDDGCAASYY